MTDYGTRQKHWKAIGYMGQIPHTTAVGATMSDNTYYFDRGKETVLKIIIDNISNFQYSTDGHTILFPVAKWDEIIDEIYEAKNDE